MLFQPLAKVDHCNFFFYIFFFNCSGIRFHVSKICLRGRNQYILQSGAISG